MSAWDLALHNGHVATMIPDGETLWGAVRDAVVLTRGEEIAWVGPRHAAPRGALEAARAVVDLGGGWVTPGLIDCHTHLVFGGTRAVEWERRLGGASYEEIARAGGGILSTVRATREAPREALLESAAARVAAFVDHGVTTIEVKSGYGLELETELRMLDVAREIGPRCGLSVSTTLLGAHALPPEFAGDRAGYLDLVCDEMIPEAARRGLADAVDAFCEGIAFTPSECIRVLRTGLDHGLAARLHADQLSDLGGAGLAAELGARSADHLEYTSEAGARAMGEAGTAAVLLPGAWYFLGETARPPIEAFRAHDVPLVVASDANPGSSPITNPLLALNQACVLFGLTPAEALTGMTRLAAPVLGLADRGTVEPGRRADLVCWPVEAPSELCYWIGGVRPDAVIAGGIRLR